MCRSINFLTCQIFVAQMAFVLIYERGKDNKTFLVTHAELKSYIIEKHWEKAMP
jgi:hypothetical protein